MKFQTIPKALDSLADAIGRAHADAIKAKILPFLNGEVFMRKATWGAPVPHLHAPAKRPYKRTPAGRARQIAAMKAYWKKRKAGKK